MLKKRKTDQLIKYNALIQEKKKKEDSWIVKEGMYEDRIENLTKRIRLEWFFDQIDLMYY